MFHMEQKKGSFVMNPFLIEEISKTSIELKYLRS